MAANSLAASASRSAALDHGKEEPLFLVARAICRRVFRSSLCKDDDEEEEEAGVVLLHRGLEDIVLTRDD